ncbi:MAG: hypothetical protein ACRDKI_03065 [Solirubrobacterales bacterium]
MLAGTVVYTYLGRTHAIPEWTIDEILYGQMAKGIAAGDGAVWRGQALGISPIYSYMIAPAWALFDPTTAYGVARAIGVAIACTTVIPAWLVSRELTSGWRVWIAPVGTLLGTWMITTTRLLTENLAWPLATWSLAALVICLARERSRGWLTVAIGCALAATAVRLQLVILLPVVPLAYLLDAVARGAFAPTARVRALSKGGAAVVALPALAALPVGNLLGRYSGITAHMPSLAGTIYWSFQNLIELALMTGVIPVVVLIALAVRRANWSDRKAGPLLCVAVPMLVLLVLQAGWFSAGHTTLLLDRYMMYFVPLALLAVAIAPGRVTALAAGAAAVVIGLPVITMPIPDGLSYYSDGFASLTHLTVGESAGMGGTALTAFALIVMVFAFVGTTLAGVDPEKVSKPRRRRAAAAAPAACLMIALALMASSAWDWNSTLDRTGETARVDYPTDRAWVDHAGSGPVSMIVLTKGVRDQGYITELFNDRIEDAYALDPLPSQSAGDGYACQLKVAPDGTLQPQDCPAPGSQMLLLGVDAEFTFANQTGSVSHRQQDAELVTTDGAPHALASVALGCPQERICSRLGQIAVWNAKPAELSVHVRTGAKPQKFEIGKQSFSVPAHTSRDLVAKIPAQATNTRFDVDGPLSLEALNAVRSIDLLQGSGSTRIYSTP